MAVLGIFFSVIALYGIVSWAVTDRKLYLSVLLWAIPICCMSFGDNTEISVDGLVVLISFLLSAETIYSTHNVRLWNTEERKKGGLFVIASYIFNIVVSFYFSVQSYSLGYMPFLNIFGNAGIYISLLLGLVCAYFSCTVFIYTTDKYFSKKSQFILIKCGQYRSKNTAGIKQKGIKGIQNGKTYIFHTTYKAQFLLKNERSLIMNVRTGVLGGIYVSGKELFVNKNRQLKRVNRILIRRGIFTLAAVFVIVLFFYRVILGMSFESIFSVLAQNISK